MGTPRNYINEIEPANIVLTHLMQLQVGITLWSIQRCGWPLRESGLREQINLSMDKEQSASGQGNEDKGDFKPVYIADNCDDGPEWTSTS